KMIITGITSSTYAPENKITRAQFATLIVRALGIESNASKAVFSDVKAGDWFAGAVDAAVDAGVIKGYTDGTFKPNAFVTREEVAAMAVQALKVAGQDTSVTAEETGQYLAQFKDGSKIDSWARAVVAAAAKNGIIKGNTNGAFTPAGNSTRAESAVMIKNMLAKAKFI
ncbi:MAG: S-layer homology domain-containing protein, partial [Eubacteriales bacterium]